MRSSSEATRVYLSGILSTVAANVVVAPETLPTDELRPELAITSGITWVPMDGSAMRRLGSLMVAFQDSFAIPDYFGHNWPALDETLCDLE